MPQGCAVERAYNIDKDIQIQQIFHKYLIPNALTVRQHETITKTSNTPDQF